MLLIDTSVWILVFRDRTGLVRQKLENKLRRIYNATVGQASCLYYG